MKKVLSLILVAVMLLSMLMLTSCDPIEAVTGFFADIFGDESNVKTTITEEEWKDAWNVNNFTLELTDEDAGMLILAAENRIKVAQTSDSYSYSMVYDFEANAILSESCVGWLGMEATGSDVPSSLEDITLGGIGFLGEFDYEELEYDESKKAYVYTEEGAYGYVCEFYFEEGKLVRVDGGGSGIESIKVYDIGTTKIDISGYTIINDGKVDPNNAPANVRTTVTKEDLDAHLDLRNFTINAATMSDGIAINGTLKVSSKGAEFSIDMIYDTQTMYVAIFNGTAYTLSEFNGEYVVDEELGSIAQLEELISQVKEAITTDALTYNEEGRYYLVDVNGYPAYLYFENGQLTRVVIMMEVSYYATMEIIFELTDVGSTKVTLPTYTIIQ